MARRSGEAWRELFEAQARSGMTVGAFCRAQGLCARSFWRRKKALDQVSVVAAPSPFVRIEADAAPGSEVLENRVRLRVGRCECELGGLALGDLVRLMQALA